MFYLICCVDCLLFEFDIGVKYIKYFSNGFKYVYVFCIII